MQTMYDGINGSPQKKIANTISANATTIPLDSTSNLPDAPNLATIGNSSDAEVVLYATKSSTELIGCTRGFGGTTARSWPANTPVYRAFTKYDYDALKANINEIAIANTGGQDVSGAILIHNIDAGAHAGIVGTLTNLTTTDKTNLVAAINEVDNHADALASGAPSGTYANLAALNAANPDHSKIYITLDDGNWCYHNGTAFVAGGVYQTLMGVDDTLTQAGHAADAAAVGDAIAQENLYHKMRITHPWEKFTLTNGAVNGDFSNGTTGWSQGSGSSIQLIDEELRVAGTASIAYSPQVFFAANTGAYSPGKKLYFRSLVKYTGFSGSVDLKHLIRYPTAGSVSTVVVSGMIADQWYEASNLFTVPSGEVDGAQCNGHIYIARDTTAATLGTMYIKNAIFIDLTDIFGAGNEPTAEQVDTWINLNFEDHWFSGTKDVYEFGQSDGKILSGKNGLVGFYPAGDVISLNDLPISDPNGDIGATTLDGALTEIGRKTGKAFDSSFSTGIAITEEKDLLPVSSASWNYTRSVFSGWGAPIGNPKDFNSLVFRIRNRAANLNPVTAIRCVVKVFDRSGATLADKTIDDFNILPGEDATVIFPLNESIQNTEGLQLWAAYYCNQLIDVWYGGTGVSLNPPNYGKVCYVVDGSLTSVLQPVYDPDSSNRSKALLYAANIVEYVKPTELFIANMQTAPESDPFYEPIRVILPKEYHCVVGDTFQLFYRGVIEAVYPYQYDIRIAYNGQNGKNYPRYFQLTPESSDIGEHTLTIRVQTNSGYEVGSASCKIVVHAAPSTSPVEPINILCVGDSLTAGGTWVQEMARRLLGTGGTPAGHGLSNINFIGTVGAGDVKWEGYGGWTWNSYMATPSPTTLDMWVYCIHDKDTTDQHSIWVDANSNLWQLETIEATRLKFTRYGGHTATMPTGSGSLTHSENASHTGVINFTSTAAAGGNPFWNSATGQVDFADYCSRNGFDGIDYVYTLLTWNGQAPYRATASDNVALINSAKAFIDRLHTQFPNAKIRVMGIQVPSLNGGMGASYGASGGSYSETYGNVRTVFGVNLAYQELADDAAYSGFVAFVNISGQFDSENNMSESDVKVNLRSSKTEKRGTNGVHPSTDGYLQIGDAAYRKAVEDVS